MNKIRWGIAGSGNIANKFAKAIKNVEDAELVAVASRSEETARDFAKKHNIPNVFCGYDALAEFADVDAIYVATIHPFHKSCAEVFLNAKKHVLCEKPLCVNSADAKQLAECAKANGVFLMEAMWTRFLPAIRETMAIIERGEIGKVMAIEADFCYRETPESCAILFDNKIAGGSLLDVGIYPLHLAAFLFGTEPEEIKAASFNENGVDIHTQMILKYKNGIVANLSSAIGVQKPETAFIYGTRVQISEQ
jgi:predicted dehydrogenase